MSRNIKSESEAAHLFRKECGHLVRYVPEWDAWIIVHGGDKVCHWNAGVVLSVAV